MNAIRPSLILTAALLGGCASDGSLEGQRTVFDNPYAVPVIDRTGIGPQCDVARGQDATCLGVPVTRSGRGVTVGEHRLGSLTRAQRRILRERAELINALSKQPPPAPSPPLPEPTLPTAAKGSDKP